MDSVNGDPQSPISLHRYLYVGANPVDRVDPSGQFFDDISAAMTSAFISLQNIASAYPTAIAVLRFVSFAVTVDLLATDKDFQALYVSSGGNPAEALATEFTQALEDAGGVVARQVLAEAAETEGLVGAKFASTTKTEPGERFIRVAAAPEGLKFRRVVQAFLFRELAF